MLYVIKCGVTGHSDPKARAGRLAVSSDLSVSFLLFLSFVLFLAPFPHLGGEPGGYSHLLSYYCAENGLCTLCVLIHFNPLVNPVQNKEKGWGRR